MYLNCFSTVFNKLANDQLVCMFPQSQYDMSQRLLNYKHGLAQVALQFSQLHKDKQVKLCPWVLHHYNSHHWRSVIILEFCQPFFIPEHIKNKYSQNKRQAISQLLNLCRQNLNQRFIQIPKIFSMATVTLIRKILLFDHYRSISFEEKIKINREIAKFIRRQCLQSTEKIEALAEDLNKLQKMCSQCGEDFKAKPTNNITIRFIFITILSLKILLIAMFMAPGLAVMMIPTYFVRKIPQDLRKISQKRSNYQYKRNDLVASFRSVYGLAFYTLTFILVFLIVLGIELFRQKSFVNSCTQAFFMQAILLLCCIVDIIGYDWIRYSLKVWRYNYCMIFAKRKMQKIQELRGSLDEKIKDLMGKNIQEIRNIVN